MLLLFIFQISTFKKNGGKAISLELTAPPHAFFFLFFAKEEKPQSKEKTQNQTTKWHLTNN